MKTTIRLSFLIHGLITLPDAKRAINSMIEA